MLLTITTTCRPATDLGYLLHKHPARCQDFELSFGNAHVFFPEAGEERCTAALVLDADPIGNVTFQPIGKADESLGSPTQMAVFARNDNRIRGNESSVERDGRQQEKGQEETGQESGIHWRPR